jgi:hypothetical protein
MPAVSFWRPFFERLKLLFAFSGFIVLATPSLEATITTPFLHYKPASTCISFDLTGYKATLSLSLPKSNTAGEFLTESSKEFCTIDEINAVGSYTYYSCLDLEKHLEGISLDLQVSFFLLRSTGEHRLR